MATMRLVVPKAGKVGSQLRFLAGFLNLSEPALVVADSADSSVELSGAGKSYRSPATIAKALLDVAVPPQKALLGNGASTTAQASHWLSELFDESKTASAILGAADAVLATSSFLAGPAATIADITLFYGLNSELKAGAAKDGLKSFPNVARWVGAAHAASSDSALNPAVIPASIPVAPATASPDAIAKALATLLAAAPTPASTPAPAPAPAAAPAAAAAAGSSAGASASSAAGAGPAGDKAGDGAALDPKAAKKAAKLAAKKAAKKEKAAAAAASGGKGGKGGKGGAAAGAVSPMAECEFLVGRVLKCWKHPDAEKLFCEEIDCGEASGPRQIASGLVEFYADPEELVGKLVLVAANLKPRPLVGFKSHGMVLCASTEGKTAVAVLEPPEGAALGERVAVEGHVSDPAAPSRMAKKKILEGAFPDLKIGDDLVASYKGIPFMTSAGAVTVSNPVFKGANIA